MYNSTRFYEKPLLINKVGWNDCGGGEGIMRWLLGLTKVGAAIFKHIHLHSHLVKMELSVRTDLKQ